MGGVLRWFFDTTYVIGGIALMLYGGAGPSSESRCG
jgi:hypothetical protein